MSSGIAVSILSTSLRWLITYNVLIEDAKEAEEFLEAEKVEGEGIALVFIEDSYFLVLTIILNQQEIF